MNNDNNPTMQTYKPLYNLIDAINNKFFDGKLPPVLLTLQRQPKVFGYMSKDRFVNNKGQTTHELAVNPDYFPIFPLPELMQTIAHELVHLNQMMYGKPSRNGYHNKEFAQMMESIGLMASSTGKEGGKKTGQKMADYIIKGGKFEKFCKEMLESDFKIEWYDRFPPRNITPKEGSFMYEVGHAVIKNGSTLNDGFEILGITSYEDHEDEVHLNDNSDAVTFSFTESFDQKDIDENFTSIVQEMYQAEPKKQTRYKFTCPDCRANLWGKPSLKVQCLECNKLFQVQGYGAEEISED